MIYIEMFLITLFGAFLHFLYEMSHHNKFVALFAAVNESTWEHIKIGMTPSLLFGFHNLYLYGLNGNLIIGESLRLLTIILLIPILFYSYTALTKKAYLWLDIVCFYIAIMFSCIVEHYFLIIDTLPFIYTYICCILLFIELAAYFIFTIKPLKNFIFEDPITHKYGIKGHPELHHHDHKH